MTKTKTKMDKENGKVIKAYKGFNQDFKCRDMQYEVGKEYEHDGSIKCCESGFHACENPLDVLDYYDLTDSRFAEVELSGDIDKSKDTKLCASKIAVKAELKLADFIKLSVEYIKELVRQKPNDEDKGDYSQLASSGNGSKLASSGDYSQLASSGDNSKLASSGNGSKLASSGDYSKLASSGDRSKLASSGDDSKLASSGDNSKLASSGDDSQLASSGDDSKLASSGNGSKLASSGNGSKLASSGNGSKLASSGDYSKLASSGDRSQLASSGDDSQLASSGDNSKLASSGDYSQLASSGDNSKLASSGDYSQLASSGDDSVVMNAGVNGIAKAKKGSWITLAEWDYDANQGALIPVCVKTVQVDGDRIKEDTWYKLEDGEFKEVAE